MYLDSKDFQTIWQLAHNWVGADPDKSDPNTLSDELKEAIQRLMSAAINQALPSRTKKLMLFMDETFFTLVFDFRHYMKFRKCLRQDEFDKAYLNSIYVKRSDVLRWCQNEFLIPPPVWKLPEITQEPSVLSANEQDDENDDWFTALTPKRKQRVVCLEMAKKLWKINSELSYEEVYRHPIMRQYGNPDVFTLNSFKKWARDFAPDAAKSGGRPKETNNYSDLIKR